MKSKEKVLAELLSPSAEYTSGEELSEKLGISRNAVWKAVNSLRSEGWKIEAVTNRGYRLSDSDILTREHIARYLPQNSRVRTETIECFRELTSTSRILKEKALSGAAHGTLITADSQTQGAAHHSNSFYSPAGGIYMSLLLRAENFPFTEAEELVTLSAVSVCETIRDISGKTALIRGVNDVTIDGRKVSGIKTESMSDFESGELEWIVAGIGINYCFTPGSVPESLREIAGGIYNPDEHRAARALYIARIASWICDTAPHLTYSEIRRMYEDMHVQGS